MDLRTGEGDLRPPWAAEDRGAPQRPETGPRSRLHGPHGAVENVGAVLEHRGGGRIGPMDPNLARL